MPYGHRLLPASFRSASLVAAFICAMPFTSAYAQQSSLPGVRILKDQVDVQSNLHGKGETLMRAPKGTVLETFYVQGDRYAVRDDNWYWVLLPRDEWGTRQTGWVSGRDVEFVPAPPRAAMRGSADAMIVVSGPRNASEGPSAADTSRASAPVAAARPVASTTATNRLEVSEVIVNFAFDKSDLTDETKARLDRAMEMLKNQPQAVSFTLAGHADSRGSEPYNEKLGLARATAVSKYLADQHKVAAGKINVASFGEKQPAAPNTTDEGRAENRRVVVKVE
jgi:peptidoglycan-associated lipoprotein